MLSLIAHALLLSISLGGQTFGLPALTLPWKERRLAADDLKIMLAPVPKPALAATPIPMEPAPRAIPDLAPIVRDRSNAPSDPAPTAPPPPAAAKTDTPTVEIPPAAMPPPPPAPALPVATISPPPPVQRSEAAVPDDTHAAAQKKLEQEKALEQTKIIEIEKQNAVKLRQAELAAEAQREAIRQDQLRQEAARAEQSAKSEAARKEVEQKELARQDAVRQEAARQEQLRQTEKAKQEAAQLDLQRSELARREAERQEAARQEQARQAQIEATRLAQQRAETAKQEAAREEGARQAAARQAAADQEATRLEAAKQAAARQEAAKQDAARQELAKLDAVKKERLEQEAQREERLRAIGRQLNAEAAQREAVPTTRSLLPGASSMRRGWLLGRGDANADLVLYAEAMSRKFELNMAIDMVREVVKQPHTQPVVTIAIRADGSVEKVTFEVSSGVPAIDEAIRKVIASQAPFAKFPPSLARQYDVIEIRRTWTFDIAIRLQ